MMKFVIDFVSCGKALKRQCYSYSQSENLHVDISHSYLPSHHLNAKIQALKIVVISHEHYIFYGRKIVFNGNFKIKNSEMLNIIFVW